MVLGFIVQPSHTLLIFQAATVVPMMDLSLQMIQDRYPIQHHSSKFIFSTSWLQNSYTPYKFFSFFCQNMLQITHSSWLVW
jgi:hypothetical protein